MNTVAAKAGQGWLARLMLLGLSLPMCGLSTAATFCVYVNKDGGNTRMLSIPVDAATFKGQPKAFANCLPSELTLLATHPAYSIPKPKLTIVSRDEDGNRQEHKLQLGRYGSEYTAIVDALMYDSTQKDEIGENYQLQLIPVDVDNSIIVKTWGKEFEKFPARKYRYHSRQTPTK